MTEQLTFGSLFSGIGGIDLGLERAGWTCAWQVEVNQYCQQVLAGHWPDVPRYGDIKELDPNDLSRVDLVAGGFPCPPVSAAGLRMAMEFHAEGHAATRTVADRKAGDWTRVAATRRSARLVSTRSSATIRTGSARSAGRR